MWPRRRVYRDNYPRVGPLCVPVLGIPYGLIPVPR